MLLQALKGATRPKNVKCVALRYVEVLMLAALLGQVGAAPAPSPTWNKDLKALGNLTVSDSGDLVFIGLDAKLHRVDSSGKERWNYTLGDVGRAQPVLTPQGNTLVAAYDDTVQAIDPNGKKLWALKLDGDLFASPALRLDGSVVVASSAGSVYAVSPGGQILWQRQVGAPIYSSPVVDGAGRIYFGTQGNRFMALDGSGAVLWSFATQATVFSSPALDGAGNLYFGSGDKTIYSLTPDGKLRWSYKTGGFVNASPIVTGSGLVVVGSYDGKLYALDSAGQLRWSYDAGASLAAPAAELTGGTLLVGDLGGTLHALNPNGQVLWTLKAGDKIDTSANVSPQGTVYLETGAGKVSAWAGLAALADGPWSFYRQQPAGYGRPPTAQEQTKFSALKQAAAQKALANLPKASTPLPQPVVVSPAPQQTAPANLSAELRLEDGQLFLPAASLLGTLGANQTVILPGSATFALGQAQNALPLTFFAESQQPWVALKALTNLKAGIRAQTVEVRYNQGHYQLWLPKTDKPLLDLALGNQQWLAMGATKEFPDVIRY